MTSRRSNWQTERQLIRNTKMLKQSLIWTRKLVHRQSTAQSIKKYCYGSGFTFTSARWFRSSGKVPPQRSCLKNTSIKGYRCWCPDSVKVRSMAFRLIFLTLYEIERPRVKNGTSFQLLPKAERMIYWGLRVEALVCRSPPEEKERTQKRMRAGPWNQYRSITSDYNWLPCLARSLSCRSRIYKRVGRNICIFIPSRLFDSLLFHEL